jgi:hypothetical protein
MIPEMTVMDCHDPKPGFCAGCPVIWKPIEDRVEGIGFNFPLFSPLGAGTGHL